VERASLRWSPCRVVKGPVHKSIRWREERS
jgi:hypothetical protein